MARGERLIDPSHRTRLGVSPASGLTARTRSQQTPMTTPRRSLSLGGRSQRRIRGLRCRTSSGTTREDITECHLFEPKVQAFFSCSSYLRRLSACRRISLSNKRPSLKGIGARLDRRESNCPVWKCPLLADGWGLKSRRSIAPQGCGKDRQRHRCYICPGSYQREIQPKLMRTS